MIIQNSALRLLEIIKTLIASPKTREEICFELDKKGEGIYKNTVSKYFRTLRDTGFEIKKENGRFKILKTPFLISLSEDEIKGFEVCAFLVSKLYSKKDKDKFKTIKNKILNMVKTKRTPDLEENNVDCEEMENLFNKIDKLNEFICLKEAEIKFLYQNKQITFIPEELRYKKSGVFLFGYDTKEDKQKELKLDLISDIMLNSFYPKKKPNIPSNTAFKIKGRLKNNYILKENENAVYLNGETIILNNTKDKNALFSRLIKYGKFAEVLYPEKEREEFIRRTKELIEYYSSM